MAEENLKAKKAKFELYRYLNDSGTNFTQVLYSLIFKADPINLIKISRGYPDEVNCYREWQSSKSEKEFFSDVAAVGTNLTLVNRRSDYETRNG